MILQGQHISEDAEQLLTGSGMSQGFLQHSNLCILNFSSVQGQHK